MYGELVEVVSQQGVELVVFSGVVGRAVLVDEGVGAVHAAAVVVCGAQAVRTPLNLTILVKAETVT